MLVFDAKYGVYTSSANREREGGGTREGGEKRGRKKRERERSGEIKNYLDIFWVNENMKNGKESEERVELR